MAVSLSTNMELMMFLKALVVLSFLLLILVLPEPAMSAPEPTKSAGVDQQNNVHEMSNNKEWQLRRQMRMHGFLLWASMGLLMPVGVLAIRMSTHVRCGKTLRMLFYSHVILQTAAIFLAIAGAVLSVRNFENAFNNAHQRLGLALYALMLLQLLLGFFRTRSRRDRWRSIWYFLHWFAGTGLCITGAAAVYLGLHAYQAKTQRSTRTWTALFTAEVSVVGFVYLLQDRWDYMLKQGTAAIHGAHEQITPADHMAAPPPPRIAIKVVGDVRINGAT